MGQKIKLIDLDASASFNRGESAGAKFSSGYIPPELLYLDQDGHPKVRAVQCSAVWSSVKGIRTSRSSSLVVVVLVVLVFWFL